MEKLTSYWCILFALSLNKPFPSLRFLRIIKTQMKNDYTRMTQGIDVGGVGVGMGRFDPVGQREGTGDDGGGGPNTRPSWPSMGRVIRCTLV